MLNGVYKGVKRLCLKAGVTTGYLAFINVLGNMIQFCTYRIA